jgi:tRNA (cmo5U34)-methyltransferase
MTDADAAWTPSDTELFANYGDAFVPRRAEQISTVCDLLGDIPLPHVLDLCCGEGLLSEEYLRRSGRDARVTLLDGSADMLHLATARLAPYRDRVTTTQADITDTHRRQGVTYGGVMTSLAVHHLDGPAKQALYRDIHAMLAPGGVFVMADLIEPTGLATRAVAADHWDNAVRDASPEAAAAFRAARWNYYRFPDPSPDPYDKPSSLPDHLDWLRDTGFTEVDVAWLYAGHTIIYGRR